jgi:Zn-dependent peptidase ImmA (M78 family)
MGNKNYVLADSEFQPILEQLFHENLKKIEAGEEHLPINVEPSRIICLRLTSGGGKKIAYVKPIRGEYRLLTEKRYFLVICDDQFNGLDNNKKKWVLAHEYIHAFFDEEKQDYVTRPHDLEDFSFILNDPTPNVSLFKNIKYEEK